MALSGTSASLDAVFQAAVASFEASLTEKQRREFRACSRKEVEDTIRAIDGRLASQRKQRNMQRIAKFVEGMDQLGRVIELFVNVDATVAFVWAPIKFVLLVRRKLLPLTKHLYQRLELNMHTRLVPGRRHLGRDAGLSPRYLRRNRRLSSQLVKLRKPSCKALQHRHLPAEILLRCARVPQEGPSHLLKTK